MILRNKANVTPRTGTEPVCWLRLRVGVSCTRNKVGPFRVPIPSFSRGSSTASAVGLPRPQANRLELAAAKSEATPAAYFHVEVFASATHCFRVIDFRVA